MRNNNSLIKTKFFLAILIMLVSIFTFSACNQSPEDYKIEKFYGDYNNQLNEYCTVSITFFDKSFNAINGYMWDIISVNGDTFVYRDRFTGEHKEKRFDATVLNTVNELMQRLNTSINVSKNKIRLNASNTILRFNKTKYDESQNREMVYDGSQDIGAGLYKNIEEESNVQVFAVALVSNVAADEINYKIAVINEYRR